jgi:hypothetical protein
MPAPELLLSTRRPDGRRAAPTNGLVFASGQAIFLPTEPTGIRHPDRASSVRILCLPHGDFFVCNQGILLDPRPDLTSTGDR